MKNFTKENILNFIKLKKYSKYMVSKDSYIAGGCFKNIFNNEKINDIDLFFKTKEAFDYTVSVYENNEKMIKKYETDNVVAYTDTESNIEIQLVRRYFMEPEDMLNQFDFTIVKFCLYYEKNENDDDDKEDYELNVLYHNKFFEHLFLKRVVIDDRESIGFPLGTYNRMIKYAGYGYMPCIETKQIIVDIIRETDFDINANNFYNGID